MKCSSTVISHCTIFAFKWSQYYYFVNILYLLIKKAHIDSISNIVYQVPAIVRGGWPSASWGDGSGGSYPADVRPEREERWVYQYCVPAAVAPDVTAQRPTWPVRCNSCKIISLKVKAIPSFKVKANFCHLRSRQHQILYSKSQLISFKIKTT